MTPDEILAKVRKLVIETGTSATLTDDMILFYDASKGGHASAIERGEAGLDSLDMVELAMAIEDSFDVKIDDDEVVGIERVDQLLALIDKKVAAR